MSDGVELPGDDDPGRSRADRRATDRFSRVGDVHPVIADRETFGRRQPGSSSGALDVTKRGTLVGDVPGRRGLHEVRGGSARG